MFKNVPSENTAASAIKKAFEELGGVQKKPSISAWVAKNYPGEWNLNTITANLYAGCVNNPTGIRHHPNSPRFLYYRGNAEYELYNSERHGVFDLRGYPEGQVPEDLSTIEELGELASQIEAGREFAYEAHLRDYLAKNLGHLEKGLVLWSGSETNSTEYNIEGRRIDILAKDKDGIPVVIELKLSRGHERTLGQALYYRAKLKQILKVNRVRIIMVASEITDELRIASTEVTDVDLFSYALTMQVTKLELVATKRLGTE